MSTYRYIVTGMTCDHCRKAVTSKLMTIEGIDDVEVELDTGAVTVQADSEPAHAEVSAAVEEAGYVLA
jgi:copper chaperone